MKEESQNGGVHLGIHLLIKLELSAELQIHINICLLGVRTGIQPIFYHLIKIQVSSSAYLLINQHMYGHVQYPRHCARGGTENQPNMIPMIRNNIILK